MAVPSYTTDLTTYNDCTSATGWGELVGMALGAPPDVDTDLAIYCSSCISADRAKVGLNSNAFVGAGITLATGECIFTWHKFFAPNSLDTITNGGARVMIGDSLTVYEGWYMDGSDTYPYGGWKNYVVDPTTTADQTAGTPTGTYAMTGHGWKLLTAPSKGNPFNTDIIRYGRGESIFTGGETADYATFLGYSAVNDHATTGRFGLIQAVGAGYLYKGLMSLGTTATAVDMRDSNVNISIDDTLKVTSTFNRIEINNASSNVEWSNVSITALGTVSKGQLEMIDNATFSDTGGAFTDMDSFTYLSNATTTSKSFNRCGLVTQGSSTIDKCLFDTSSNNPALLSDDIESVTDCTFISAGTGYAITLDPAMTTGSYTLSGNTFSGYGSDSTTNASINYAGTGTIVLNVTGGLVPTVNYTGTGGGLSATSSVSIAINVKDESGSNIVGALVYVDDDLEVVGNIVNTTTDASGNVNTSYSGVESTATIRVRNYGYKPSIGTVSLASDSSTNIILITDPQQT